MEKLVQKYLKLDPDEILPLPTPPAVEPTPAPTATPEPEACTDGASYVADLNYDDKYMTAPPVMHPGQPFTKGWRLRNSGTCIWDQPYTFAYSSGNSPLAQMGGQPTYIKGTVAPGAVYDISVNLTAPAQPGVYQVFWQMNNAKGTAFGTTVYVGIQVQAPAPTAAPTQRPSPSIGFSVDKTNITAGECVVFTWNVQNVKAVYFYAQGQKMEDHGVAGQGSH